MYNCSTTGSLVWHIKPPNGPLIPHIFGDSDSDQCLNEGEYLLSLQITHTAAMSTLSSLLIIPYTSNWAGTEILCADNTTLDGNKTRLYVIAGTYQHDWGIHDYPHKFNSCSCLTVSRVYLMYFKLSMLHINNGYRIQSEIFVRRKISPFFMPPALMVENYMPKFLSHVNDYTAPMVTFTAWVKFIPQNSIISVMQM